MHNFFSRSTKMKPRETTSSDKIGRSALVLTILRGPLLMWSCFAALIYRALRLASLEVQILSSFLLCGCALTVSDWASLTKKKIDSMKSMVQNCEDSIVLDKLLQDTLSLDRGLLGCIFGSFSLYNLPFTPQQRNRILELVLPKYVPVSKTFFHPGGIRYLLPESWRNKNNKRIESSSDTSRNGDKHKTASEDGATTNHKESIHDLVWDDHTTDLCMDDDASATQSSSNTFLSDNFLGFCASPSMEAVDFNNNTSSPPPQDVSSESLNHIHQPSPSDPKCTSETAFGGSASDETWALIIRDFLTTTLKGCLSYMDESSVRNTGIVAATLFFLQMRMSVSSRRVVVRTLQGLTSFGLVGVATGCFSLWCTKRYFLPESQSLKDKEDTQRHAIDRQSPDESRNFSILSAFYFIKKILDEKLKRDQSWTKWKGFLAAVVFLYIGKMRHAQRKKVLLPCNSSKS